MARWIAALALASLAGCADFSLPPREARALPVVKNLEPRAAYGGEYIEIVGENFDPIAENNAVLFIDGAVARAESSDGTRLRLLVPHELDYTGPLIVTTPAGSSEPSALDFYPLGAGHPIYGTPVADVRLRHRPAGLVDTEESVVIASTLFDMLVTDYGEAIRLEGRPVSMARAPDPTKALVGLRTASGEGQLVLVDAESGEPLASSAPGSSRIVETIILSGPPGVPVTTVGVDAYGGWWLSRWAQEATALVPARYRLAAAEVAGGALDSAGTAYLAATVSGDRATESGLFRFQAGASNELERVWAEDEVGHRLVGALAISRTDKGEVAVVGFEDGDLGFIELGTGLMEHEIMVSYATVSAIARGVTEGKVVMAKPIDGAVFQYDVTSRLVDWTVQLRGRPTVLDVAADLDEVAVGNADENGVDVITASSGTWIGRISFGLGLGSADDGAGGAVAPYSYDPDEPERPARILVLARTPRLVLSFDPDTLELQGTLPLDAEASEPVRLVVTPDLQTLVVHRHELGFLEEDGERIVTTRPFDDAPEAVIPLADGRVVVGAGDTIHVLEWVGGMLERTGGVKLESGRALAALAPHGRQVLAVWRTSSGFGGALWDAEALVAGGAPAATLALPASLGDFLGLLSVASGPAAIFGQSELPGPAVLPFETLTSDAPAPMESALGASSLVGTTPDGRLAIWAGDSGGDQLVRLFWYDDSYGFWPYAAYRLERKASGPTCDPSGLWLYIPVPELDMLSVTQ